MTNYGDSISTRGILGGYLGTLGRIQPAGATTEPTAYIFGQSTLSCQAQVAYVATCTIKGNSTLICSAFVIGNDISATIVGNSVLSASTNVIRAAQATVNCESVLTDSSKVIHSSQAIFVCNPALSCSASRQFYCNSNLRSTVIYNAPPSLTLGTTANLNSISNLIATGTAKQITNLIGNATLLSTGTVQFAGNADIRSSISLLANPTLEEPILEEKPTPPSRIDWENTLGAAPGPVFGWAGGVGGLPPAIAITFIHGKHIYSDVKKKKRDIVVQISDVLRETNEITVSLINVSKNTNKIRFKMKADHGKIYALEK